VKPLRTSGAPSRTDDEILDAHAELARKVDPGSTVTTFSGHEHGVAADAREPRRLVDLEADAVAQTVAEVLAVAGILDHAAAAASASRPLTPAATAARPASWASRTSAWISRACSPGSPTATVRVQSEQ